MKRDLSGKPGLTWLWSTVYKGLEVRFAGRALWIGWTNRDYKARGW